MRESVLGVTDYVIVDDTPAVLDEINRGDARKPFTTAIDLKKKGKETQFVFLRSALESITPKK